MPVSLAPLLTPSMAELIVVMVRLMVLNGEAGLTAVSKLEKDAQRASMKEVASGGVAKRKEKNMSNRIF